MIRIFILIFALFCGGVATWLTMIGGSGQSIAAPPPPRSEVDLREVLVTSVAVKQGEMLAGSNMAWQPWPAESVHQEHVTRDMYPDALLEMDGTLARASFTAGEPVRASKLAQEGIGFMSVSLPTGMRAVAVRISAESTAGGFILPNDRVDVVHTVTAQNANGGIDSNSRTILTNVRVLAVDQTSAETETASAFVGKTATLEVMPGHVEILTSAESSGSVSLALRSAVDNSGLPAAVAADRDTIGMIRMIKSGSVETVNVRRTGGTP